jgi:hypothetical protein
VHIDIIQAALNLMIGLMIADILRQVNRRDLLWGTLLSADTLEGAEWLTCLTSEKP